MVVVYDFHFRGGEPYGDTWI